MLLAEGAWRNPPDWKHLHYRREEGGPTRHRPARENKHRWQRDLRILETWGTQPVTGNGGQSS